MSEQDTEEALRALVETGNALWSAIEREYRTAETGPRWQGALERFSASLGRAERLVAQLPKRGESGPKEVKACLTRDAHIS